MKEAFDKVEFLKVCLQASGVQIDFDKVAEELSITKGAASKRYSRMMATGSTTASTPQNLQYIQTCLKVSGAKLDHTKIAAQLGITKGASSKRFSRLMSASAAAKSDTAADGPSEPLGSTSAAKDTGTGQKRKLKATNTDDGSEAEEVSEVKKKGGRAVAAKKRKVAAETESEVEAGEDGLEVVAKAEKKAKGGLASAKNAVKGKGKAKALSKSKVESEVESNASGDEETLDVVEKVKVKNGDNSESKVNEEEEDVEHDDEDFANAADDESSHAEY